MIGNCSVSDLAFSFVLEKVVKKCFIESSKLFKFLFT